MAITRIAKGTRKNFTAGTTLTLTDVQADEGQAFLVGAAYRNSTSVDASCTWGAKGVRKVASQFNNGVGVHVFLRKNVGALGGATRDVTVTWDSSVTARMFFVTAFETGLKPDEIKTRSQANVTNPNTALTVNSIHMAPEMSVAVFASNGRADDDFGTIGESYSLGQRDGSPAANLTISEFYKELTVLEQTRCLLTDATSRNWSMALVTMSQVVKDDALIIWKAKIFDQLVISGLTNGIDAWMLLCYAHFNYWYLPSTPASDTLTELGMTLTQYQTARTLLSTEGIVTLESDGTIS